MLLSKSAFIVTKTVFVCGATLVPREPLVALLPTFRFELLAGLLAAPIDPPKELLVRRFPEVLCLWDWMLGLEGALSP